MSNPENLVPNEERTPSQRRANAHKAGVASGESRRRKKLMREVLEELLSDTYTDKEGRELDGTTMLMLAAIKKAQKGDMRAMEFIRDTIGQKPTEHLEFEAVSPETRAEMERLFGLVGEK